ncbi:hypothetical protein KUTeg_015810 [Tegillarca granosa]|uniref:Adenosine 3'-phospho 5'-phosphosulfate transporter 2 n=1 Tax=Tegillarca granosa TaxID=220873 RepID=A0ABQ9EPE8_TEGGR|nr:hypothetical protein KUTeg_015810 [Tegillarca granosa]
MSRFPLYLSGLRQKSSSDFMAEQKNGYLKEETVVDVGSNSSSNVQKDEELLFRLEGFQTFGWFLTLVQFACYTVFGLLELQLTKDKTRKIPLRTYALLAFLTVATMGLSNTSVGYLNYPTQVLFKCCKLIPVMIGGILIQGKRYKPIDVGAVLCMCSGLIMFTLADSSVYPKFNTYGVILISLALCADGVIGNVQEKTLKQYSCRNSEMVLYSYSIGFVYILIGLILTGGLLPAFHFFNAHPVKTYGYTVIFSVTGYIVTTGRKAVTIVLSFIFFAKPFTFQYLWAGSIVVLGIYLNVYSKNKSALDDKFKRIWTSTLHTLGFRKKFDYSDVTMTV